MVFNGVGPGTYLAANFGAALPYVFETAAHRLWNDSALAVYMAKKKEGEGPVIYYTVSNGGMVLTHRGENYPITAATDAYNTDVVVGTLNRAILAVTFSLSDRALALVGSYKSSFPEPDLVRLAWLEQYLKGLATIARGVEVGMAVGTGTALDPQGNSQSDLVGIIPTLIAAGITKSGTYAGIAFSSTQNVGMLCAGVDVGATNGGAINRKIIRNFLATMQTLKNRNPRMGMCSPATGAILAEIADVQIQYNSIAFNQQLELMGNRTFENAYMPYCLIYQIPIFTNAAWASTTTATNAGGNVASADGYLVFSDPEQTELNYLRYPRAVDSVIAEALEAVSSDGGEDTRPVGLPVATWSLGKQTRGVTVTMDLEVGAVHYELNKFGILANITSAQNS